MLVHIFDDTPHHYKPMKAFFTEQCQVNVAQQFWVKQSQKTSKELSDGEFTYYHSSKDLISRLNSLPKHTQVVFHGLLDTYIWLRLIPLAVTKQCSCVFWGAEIYRHLKSHKTLKQRIAYWLHILLVKRMKQVICLNNGDGQLIEQHLLRTDVNTLPYPLIGYQGNTNSDKNTSQLKVLVGNSAAASNEHIWALQQLAHLADENVELILPLNYAGETDYIERVISFGRSIFGKKLTAITSMLDKKSYDQLLADVDITVFAHNRQQGLYVVYAMLLMGKPVFLRQTTTSFKNLTQLGFSIGATESLEHSSFDALKAIGDTEKNKKLMKENFTEQALAPKWSAFFNGLFS